MFEIYSKKIRLTFQGAILNGTVYWFRKKASKINEIVRFFSPSLSFFENIYGSTQPIEKK